MNVLLVEKDKLLADLIVRILTTEKHQVAHEKDGALGYEKAKDSKYDLIIMGVDMPGKSGPGACCALRREQVSTPVILVSQKYSEAEVASGLDAGADDFMVMPIGFKELPARVRAVTRRPPVTLKPHLSVGDLIIYPNEHIAKRSGVAIDLRPKEYQLLEYMMRNQDKVLSKHVLLKSVWNVYADSASNRVEVCIRNLRKKIDKPFNENLIRTVHGVGYKIISSCSDA